MNDGSMRVCVVSDSEELSPPLQECQQCFTVLKSKITLAFPDADLYIWDYSPGLELRQEIAARRVAQHLLLCEPKHLDELSDLLTSVCVLLKPLAAFTLRTFAELAWRSWQLRQKVSQTDSLRSDRDALLQYVLDVNLRLQKYDQERNNFLARALHDFRAPLTALHGYCGLLSEEKVGSISASQRELLDRMQRSTRRLTQMTRCTMELLLEGRFERQPARNPGDIAATVNHAAHDVYPMMKERGIELTIDVQDAPAALLFETGAIQQVLVNLLENSCKFTPSHGRIAVRCYPTYQAPGRQKLPPGNYPATPNAYRIDISDSGPGVSRDLTEKIFEQYASYAGGADRSIGGLGLAICKAIITAHCGSIWATPSANGGEFSFVLPLCAGAALGAAQSIDTLPLNGRNGLREVNA